MAGEAVQPSQRLPSARAPPAHLRALSAFARAFDREMAIVEIGGKHFYAMVDKGTPFERALGAIVDKYGGGVAKLNYPGMGDEIVAVMLGNRMLVKGEPDKISRADFSSFGADAQSVRALAVEKSRDSDGGIHFFVGSSGIPVAAGSGGQVVFPNGSEVRVGDGANYFSLRVVAFNADPKTLSELSGGGGMSISAAAGAAMSDTDLQKMASAHGGVRSEKLLLLENKLLIYDFLSRELSTASEYSKAQRPGALPDSFVFQPPQYIISPLPALPASAAQGIGFQNGPLSLPMDGSLVRVPYLYVKVFDGGIKEALMARTSFVQDDPFSQSRVPQAPQAQFAPHPAMHQTPAHLRAEPVRQHSPFASINDGCARLVLHDSRPPPAPHSKTGMSSTAAPHPCMAPVPRAKETPARGGRGRKKRYFADTYPPHGIPAFIAKSFVLPRAPPAHYPSEAEKRAAKGNAPAQRAEKPKRKPRRRRPRTLAETKLPPRPDAKRSPKGKGKPPEAKAAFPRAAFRRRPSRNGKPESVWKSAKPASEALPARKAKKTQKPARNAKPLRPATATVAPRQRAARNRKPPSPNSPLRPFAKPRAGKSKRRRMPAAFYNELLGIYQWKRRGRKFRMKKKSAP